MKYSLRTAAVLIFLICLGLTWFAQIKKNRTRALDRIEAKLAGQWIVRADFLFGRPQMSPSVIDWLTLQDVIEVHFQDKLPEACPESSYVVKRALYVEMDGFDSITNVVLREVVGPRVMSVGISESNLAEDLFCDFPALCKVEMLTVSRCGPLSNRSLAAIAALPHLTDLAVEAKSQAFQEITALRSATQLTYLRITVLADDRYSVDDEDARLPPPVVEPNHLQWLRGCDALETLDINGPVNEEAIELIVEECPSLRQLHLRDSTLGTRAVTALKRLTRLQELILYECQMTEAARRLSTGLPIGK